MGIRIALMITGAAVAVFSFWTHCVKKLTVDYAVTWSLLGAGLILMGVIPAFSEWADSLGPELQWVLFCTGALVLFTEAHKSLEISRMALESKELAMRVALLDQENEAMRAELERLAGEREETDAEKDFVRY